MDYKQRGWKFPVAPDPSTGRMRMSEGNEDIGESIGIILFTNLGERVMEPNFGSDIQRYIFAPASPQTFGMLAAEIQRAITEWEPRVKDVSVNINAAGDGERVRADISCTTVTEGLRISLNYDIDLNK